MSVNKKPRKPKAAKKPKHWFTKSLEYKPPRLPVLKKQPKSDKRQLPLFE